MPQPHSWHRRVTSAECALLARKLGRPRVVVETRSWKAVVIAYSRRHEDGRNRSTSRNRALGRNRPRWRTVVVLHALVRKRRLA